MSRQKKTRRIADIMPARKADKRPEAPTSRAGRKPTRYELDAKAREEKRKKKHKGLAAGSRHSAQDNNQPAQTSTARDPRLGSRKKVPLMVEFVNKPQQDPNLSAQKTAQKSPHFNPQSELDPHIELEQLENNECLNQLLDALDAGKTLSADDQRFVDDCLARIAQLMEALGIEDDEENDDDLYRTFATMDINRFR